MSGAKCPMQTVIRHSVVSDLGLSAVNYSNTTKRNIANTKTEYVIILLIRIKEGPIV